MRHGIPIALGSDSHAQINPLEDARQLDYHLRLLQRERAILDQIDGEPLASRLFDCATKNGGKALQLPVGEFAPGCFADFFTVDLKEISVAGHSPDSLLSMLVFALDRLAISDVVVDGKFILRDHRHPLHEEIVSRYEEVDSSVWQQRREDWH